MVLHSFTPFEEAFKVKQFKDPLVLFAGKKKAKENRKPRPPLQVGSPVKMAGGTCETGCVCRCEGGCEVSWRP